MESNFIVCQESFDALEKTGIAQEVYAVIASAYIDTGYACEISENNEIIKFLEDRGYITTHETKRFRNHIYAKPFIKTCDHTQILCRNKHYKSIVN